MAAIESGNRPRLKETTTRPKSSPRPSITQSSTHQFYFLFPMKDQMVHNNMYQLQLNFVKPKYRQDY